MAVKILNGIDVDGSMNIAASDVPNLDASKITSGTFSTDRIPNLSGVYQTAGDYLTLETAETTFQPLGNYLTSIPAEYLTQIEGDARYLRLSGGTMAGQVIFPSAATTKPVLPNGFISRNDNDDTTGRHDIWGISERYYPSNSTAGDAWGIQWSGTPNDIVFVGGGEDKVTISLDEGNISTLGAIWASGGNSSQWNTAYGWGNHASVGYLTSLPSHNHDTLYDAIGSADAVNLRIDEDVLPAIPTNNNQLTNGAGYITSADGGNAQTLDGIDSSGFVKTSGDQTITGTKRFSNSSIVIEGSHASISFIDNTSSADDFYLHVNSNNFYVLRDTAGANIVDGGYDTPHPMELQGDTNRAYFFGNMLNTAAYQPSSAFATSAQGTNADTAHSWGNHAGLYDSAGSADVVNQRIDQEVLTAIPTNNNQLTNGAGYATTSYVNTAVANIVDTAPAALNTLNELAAALGDDANFSTTVANSIGAIDSRIDEEVLPAIPTNNNQLTNGAGYITSADGGNAQTLDGIDSSSFVRSDATDTLSGHYTFSYNSGIIGSAQPGYTQGAIEIITSADNTPAIGFHRGGVSATALYEYDGQLYVNPWTARAQEGLLLSSGNISAYADQAGAADAVNARIDSEVLSAIDSKLDSTAKAADSNLLDGINSTSFLRSDANDTHSGQLALTSITAASGSIANTKGSYLHIGAWGTGRTAVDAVLVNTAYRSDILSYTRSFTIGNTSRNFNGSANVSWTLAEIGAEAAGAADTVNTRIDEDVLPAIPTNNNQLTNGAGYLTSLPNNAATFTNDITLNDSGTTANFIAELTNEHGAFQNNYKAFKVSWSYAGNSNLDVGFESVELAGCLIECWGGTYKHVRLTRPTTGTGGRSIYVYNDQGSSYAPGWRQIWTSDEFSSTNISNWNTAHGWGNHAGLYDAAGSADAVNTRIDEDVLPAIPTNNNQLTNGAGYITSADGGNAQTLDGINSTSFLRSDADDTMSGTLTITGSNGVSRLRIEGTTPTIDLDDADGDSFYIHVNANNFYILTDRDGGGNYGTWETPHPLLLEADTNRTYLWGNLVGNAAYASTSDFDAAGAADTVNSRIDDEVLPTIGDITLASLGFTGATNANYITNNNQLTNGAGYLTSSNDRVYITDSRGAARAPSYYNDRYAQWDFQNVSDTGVGGDGWHALLTVSKWSSYDNSHRQEQLIFSGEHLWRRTATSDSAWGDNKKVWDSGNLDAFVGATVSNDTITFTKANGGTVAVTTSDADSNTWRPIDDTPVNGVTDQSISSNWAYDHVNASNPHGTTAADVGADAAGAADAVNTRIDEDVLPAIPTNNNQLTNGAGYVTSSHTHTPSQVGLSNLSANGNNLAGNFTATGDITAFSDARVKENIETLPNALESVKQMRGVTYNKIGEEKQSIGVIAQELEEVVPQLVHTDEEGMKSVAYGNITALLIEALKEQQEQIE